MVTVDQLNSHFALSGVARFDEGKRDMPRLVISTPAAEAHIYLHGAHITHFQPRGGKPLLFLSSRSNFDAEKPIRGGVPVIFPWFGQRADNPNSPMHGLVRTRNWKVESVESVEPAAGDGGAGAVRAVFAFDSTPQTRAAWDHAFALRLAVKVGRELTMQLEVINRSDAEFTFEEALHTYFAASDVRNLTIEGLAGTEYVDKNLGFERRRQDEAALKLVGPTDRVYQDTGGSGAAGAARATCVIDDPGLSRRITIAREHSRSTVVWNPWSDTIGKMPDLDPQDWPRFLCLETANAREQAIQLPAGGRHVMTATINVAPA